MSIERDQAKSGHLVQRNRVNTLTLPVKFKCFCFIWRAWEILKCLLFATVTNSRINSLVSWFIFNLQKNKQISHKDNIQHLVHESIIQVIFSILDLLFTFFPNKPLHHNLNIHFIHTWATIPCSTSRICPSWPHPWVRLNPLPACSYLVSSLLVLAHPAACYLFQWFISHMHPPLTTRWLNTIMQVNNMGVWHLMYNGHTYIYTHHIIISI